nr:tetratricopeptide repeat protein [Fodinicurvata sediminis]
MKLFRDASRKDPRSPTPWIGLGDTMVTARLLDQATEAYRNALNLAPNSIGAKLGMARIHLMLEQAPEARALLEEVRKDQPENWRIYNGLGVSADLAKNHESAQEYYLKALNLSPRNLSVLTNYSLSLALGGEFNDAIAILEDVVNEPSATSKHRQNLALVYGLSGSDQEAQQMAGTDLSNADVANNMEFYRFVRGLQNGSASDFIPRQYESGLNEEEKAKMNQAIGSYFDPPR